MRAMTGIFRCIPCNVRSTDNEIVPVDIIDVTVSVIIDPVSGDFITVVPYVRTEVRMVEAYAFVKHGHNYRRIARATVPGSFAGLVRYQIDIGVLDELVSEIILIGDIGKCRIVPVYRIPGTVILSVVDHIPLIWQVFVIEIIACGPR